MFKKNRRNISVRVRKFAVDRFECLLHFFLYMLCAAAVAYEFDAFVVVLLEATLLNC